MKKRTWNLFPALALLSAALLLATAPMAFINQTVFLIELATAGLVILIIIIYMGRIRRDIRRLVTQVTGSLSQSSQEALAAFPLPVLVCSAGGEVLWYNELFRRHVLPGEDMYGETVTSLTGGVTLEDITRKGGADIHCGQRRYSVFVNAMAMKAQNVYVLYYIENTRLKQVAEEFTLSRPSVMLLYIDNMDELLQHSRDSERAQISGRVETLLEDWISGTTGLLRKYSTDRFLVIMEQRHLQAVIVNRFNILDRVRAVQAAEGRNVTLSIGVGQGENFRESEALARQALDMALGRGGDQAALKTKNGFDFYGGVSQGVEKRTKVRTRVVASAMLELLEGSDNVLVMGHTYSDFDCLGSSAAFVSVARALGKPAWAAVRRSTTMAPELIERYVEAGHGDVFIEPEKAQELLNRRSLLVITDTHNPKMLESVDLYKAAVTVVVIDHHRKMVDHIDNAVIFYHEPFASSASEMVAELVQYMGNQTLARVDAEALLSGIMLDTRSFVMKAGVRTFEAAAYLRRFGADTVEVKRLFSGSMDLFREKSDIIAQAAMYGRTAIARHEEPAQAGGSQLRIAASQAANELLYIKGVEASFVLFIEDAVINISARSLGSFNVQLVMEALGGGGHLTMAGAQFPGESMAHVYGLLIKAIDRYQADRSRSALPPPQDIM